MTHWVTKKHENGTVKGLFRHGSGTKPDTGINHLISQEKGLSFSCDPHGFNRVIREIRAKNLFSN